MNYRSLKLPVIVAACAVAFILGAYSCSSSDATDGGTAANDGGGTGDTGGATDSGGGTTDAGGVQDTGTVTDTGSAEDTGSVTDAGGGSDAGSAGPNSWTYGGTTHTPAQPIKCEDRGPNWVIEAVDVTSALTFFLPEMPTADGTYTIVPFVSADGGAMSIDPPDAQLALYVGGGSTIATTGSISVTVSGGKASASFTSVEFFAQSQGVPGASVGTASGSLTCP